MNKAAYSSKKKYYTVTDEATGNQISVEFQPRVEQEDIKCTEICQYGNICEKLADPRNTASENSCFCDFCGSIDPVKIKTRVKGDLENEDSDEEVEENDNPDELIIYLPADGSLEKAFAGYKDIMTQVIQSEDSKKMKYFSSEEVIDGVCKDTFDCYTPEKSNCNSCNQTCILRRLFIKD